MACTDKQVRKLLMEYEKSHEIEKSSLKANMCRQTGSKYIKSGQYPCDLKADRSWRTRQDPFSEDWRAVEEKLLLAPELEAKTLFDWLCEEHPGRYQESQLRTFQRRIRDWHALHGPDQEVYFPQVHEPGKRMSTDFTCMNALGITVGRISFEHKLCHCVMTYSNWEWASICHSESLLALRQGIQSALFRLGRVAKEHWTDHSTAATHEVCRGSGEREFNKKYLDIMNHFGMTPRTIQKNSPHENGDVESLNGVLKSRINQHLLLRSSRDFGSVDEYRSFLHEILHKANKRRSERFGEETKHMRLLSVDIVPAYDELDCRVSSWSTVCVKQNRYSVPSRLIGYKVKVRCYEDYIEIFYKGSSQLKAPRLTGKGNHSINYRHVIGWLIRKPGAFRQYRYRESLYPTLNFRFSYDRLCEECSERVADLEYLRILKHAATTMESEVDAVLARLFRENGVPRWRTVVEFCPGREVKVPDIVRAQINLSEYDVLLGEVDDE